MVPLTRRHTPAERPAEGGAQSEQARPIAAPRDAQGNVAPAQARLQRLPSPAAAAAGPRARPGGAAQGQHPALRLLVERMRSGSRPGARADAARLALCVEGGGMRGCVTAGALRAMHDLGARWAVHACCRGRSPSPDRLRSVRRVGVCSWR